MNQMFFFSLNSKSPHFDSFPKKFWKIALCSLCQELIDFNEFITKIFIEICQRNRHVQFVTAQQFTIQFFRIITKAHHVTIYKQLQFFRQWIMDDVRCCANRIFVKIFIMTHQNVFCGTRIQHLTLFGPFHQLWKSKDFCYSFWYRCSKFYVTQSQFGLNKRNNLKT